MLCGRHTCHLTRSASILKAIQVNFRFKDDKIAPPETYLSAQLGQMAINENVWWYMLSENYVRAVITNIEETLNKSGQKLPNKCKTPLSSGYQPELDVTQELKADGLHRYQELVGVLWWAVKHAEETAPGTTLPYIQLP